MTTVVSLCTAVLSCRATPVAIYDAPILVTSDLSILFNLAGSHVDLRECIYRANERAACEPRGGKAQPSYLPCCQDITVGHTQLRDVEPIPP